MADDQRSARARPHNDATENLRARLAALQTRHEKRIADRDAAGVEIGRRVVEEVARKCVPAPARRDPAVASYAQPVDGPLMRPKNWRGPTATEFYTDPSDLERATMLECAAAYRATWGVELLAEDREAYLVCLRAIPDAARVREHEAGEVYASLRDTIRRAKAFSRASYNNASGPAGVALEAMWELLPDLPLWSDLPGYSTNTSAARPLVAQWQELALAGLGRRLGRRELAELSVLLRVVTPPYAQLLKQQPMKKTRDGKVHHRMSTSGILEWAGKHLDPVLRSQRDDGG